MARLQDFPTVTPTSSDKLLVVQSQSQGLVPYGSKLDSANPTGTGKLSLNRASGSVEGSYSVAEGLNCTASGEHSHAEGNETVASGSRAHAEGRYSTASNGYSHAEGYSSTASGNGSHAEGESTTASGARSHSEGHGTIASGDYSHAQGYQTRASRKSQFVFGDYNVADTTGANTAAKGAYIEIVGNGNSDSNRSNARTLDWSGNEVLAGGLTTGGNLNTNGIITATFNSGNPLVIDTFQSYGSCIILGFVQGIGDVAILMQFTNNTIGRCINMYTGENFSNSNLSFAFSSHTLTITQTSAAVSTLTIIKTF